MKKKLAPLLIFTLTIVICLLSLEIFLRGYFAFVTNYDIEMWKYATDLKVSVDDARSHIHASNKTMRLMNVEMKINSKGLRDREFDYQKNSRHRILALGDSVTVGWGIPLEKSLSKQIEAGLNKRADRYEILNFGIGNYNTQQILAAYEIEGRKYSPDTIIYFLHITDIEPVQKNAQGFLNRHSYLVAFLRQRMAQLKPWIFKSNHYVQYYQNLFKEPSWTNYEKVLSEMTDKIVTQDKKKLIIVILPELRSLENYPFQDYHVKVTKFFKDRNVPVIDMLPYFVGKTPQEATVAFDDPHPSQLGHDIIANVTLEALEKILK